MKCYFIRIIIFGLASILPRILASDYFDQQPKFISEDGNLIIETALDKNLTFRLRGHGIILVNNKNIMPILSSSGGALWGDSPVVSKSFEDRLAETESDINSLTDRFEIISRIIRLSENRTNSMSALGRRGDLRGLRTRVSRIEVQVARIVTGLGADNCRSNPCQNGGTCMNAFEAFQCVCPANWEGATCSIDVNECNNFANTELGCQNGATCVNTAGSYSCNCAGGWNGVHCTKRTVDCLTSGRELCGAGTCVPTGDQLHYTCICNQGWKTNGLTPACTVDINECDDTKPHCSMDPPVQCMNVPGSYMCGFCPAGYQGNGHYCADINECETNNGGCSTMPTVQCINTRGSYHCAACPVGWQGDGKVCIRTSAADACAATPDLCHPLARCLSLPSGPSCMCPNEYYGTGFGPYGCLPSSRTDPCVPNPCLNGARCNINGTSFHCLCGAGLMPPLCTEPSNPCAANPCQNGGICVPIQRGDVRFTCTCTTAFQGNVCQTPARSCGGILTNERGVLKYPLSDDPYSHNSRCAWLIRTNETQVLNVTFTKFHLEHSQECRYDWLQIHDGRSSSSYMIGRFCGDQLPKAGNIITTHNSLYLWFRADNSTAHDGFELKWESIPPVCGGVFQIETFGTITSPGSPGNYPPNRDCTWQLSAPPSKRIQLHFFAMQLEDHPNCDYDYLQIMDGPLASDVELAKYCNTSFPQPLITSHNEALLRFHSDGDNSATGFQIHYSIIEGTPGCGGTYTNVKGEFGSPSQDGSYPSNVICEYVIRMPSTESRIRIKYKKFKLERSDDCSYDYVQVFDGSSTESPLIGKFCGETIPEDFISTGNVLLIVFKSDWSLGGDGFYLNYELVCGGKFSETSGTIMSPLYPEPYASARQCIYEIEGAPGQSVALDFTDFALEGFSCDFDSITIYDGHMSLNSSVIGRYCGETLPPRAVSTHNLLTILFTSDSSISGRGFKANYNLVDVECGGIITTLGAQIKPHKNSNNDDDGYAANANCTWIIMAPKRHVVQLVFTAFALEAFPSCEADSVTLFDGIPNVGTEINKYCGTQLPPIIRSSSNILSLTFVSDYSYQTDGFLATYDFIDSTNACGGQFYSSTGMIRSPGWPDQYSGDKDCVWIINAPTGRQIELKINVFEMELQRDCRFDHLEIRNGGTDRSPLVGTFCGTDIPKTIRSHANQLYLHFLSDSSINYRGFELRWDASSSGCGGVISESPRGTITSPNYPGAYGEHLQCDWRITVAKGSTIHVIFADIDMETVLDCFFDSVELYDGRSSADKHIATLCQDNGQVEFTSSDNSLYLRMTTDFSNAGRGFDMRYRSVCNQRLTDLRGAIESPNYPAMYPSESYCEWTIVAPRGNTINIEFTEFDIGDSYMDSSTCHYDYVQIEQRDRSNAVVQTMTYCRTMPPILKSFTDIVVIKFVSDTSNNANGFHLEYSIQGCGDMLKMSEGTFSSPNYPNGYKHQQECLWTISVPYGNLIELTIEDYDLEYSPNCTKDGLSIAYNRYLLNETTFNICGTAKPTDLRKHITSHTNELYLKLYSNGDFTGRGFNASYKTIPSNCGGRFTANKGVIMSPNYPSSYKPSLYCEWLIETESVHTLRLQFVDLVVEKVDYDDECIHDSVQIYDDSKKRRDHFMGAFCGTITPNRTFLSTGNQMLIVMETDASQQMSGFKINYETTCGSRIVTNGSGLISMADNLWTTPNCTWTIMAEDLGRHVVLTILSSVKMGDNNICPLNIRIYDGDSVNATMQRDICLTFHPPAIVSTGHALTFVVTNTNQNDNKPNRFEARYSVMDNSCGNGVYKSKRGLIASPAYPNSYPLNTECIWQIQASPGNQMRLSISNLDIAVSDDCNENFLEVRENSHSGKLLGVYCGNNSTVQIPPAQELWVLFRSGDSGVGNGFLMIYTYVNEIELVGNNGIITSPLYPDFDVDGDSKKYRILVETGYIVSITITDLMVKSNAELLIYDGYDNTAALIDRYQAKPEKSIKTTTNSLYIEWTIQNSGRFRLEWSKQSATLDNAQTLNVTETMNCTANSLVTLSSRMLRTVSSPGYPYGYAENLDCVWRLTSGLPGFHVSVSFTDINLEAIGTSCVSDYVSVAATEDFVDDEPLATLCSANFSSAQRFHGTPNVRLAFHSDWYTNRTGFSADVRLECGGELTAPTDTITNAMALMQPTNSYCNWTVRVREGHTISVNISSLQLHKSTTGACNSFVILRNGHSASSPFLGTGQYCDADAALTIPNTISNYLYVQYYAGDRPALDTFSIRYQDVSVECGETIRLTSSGELRETIISSPNYPSMALAHSECVWTIVAPNGELLQIDFIEQFVMTPDPTCSKEMVELRDGATEGATLIGRFCKEIPSTQRTTSNILRVRFFTDVPMPRNGFKAKVSIAKCGGYYRSPAGVVHSSNYPGRGAYPHNSTCDYRIIGQTGKTLNLTFLALDLPYKDEDQNCSDVDRVLLYNVVRHVPEEEVVADGSDISDDDQTRLILIGEYCGTSDKPTEGIISIGNEVLVRFVTTANSNNEHTGFQLSYNSTVQRCGGDINMEWGTIQSPGYPVGRNVRIFCEWRITVPKGSRIRANIEDLDFEDRSIPTFRDMLRNSSRVLRSFGQRLMFYNDFKYLNRIRTVKARDPLQPIYSSDNKMLINLWLRSNVGHRGFRLTFRSTEPTICVGNLNEQSGQILSPQNESVYMCEYTRDRPLLLPPDDSSNTGTMLITIKVTIPTNGSCFIALPIPITVWYTESTRAKGIMRSCSNNVIAVSEYSQKTASPFRDTSVIAYSSSNSIRNFEIDYKIHKCGGLIQSNSSYVVRSPVLPVGYGEVACAWQYRALYGMKLKLTVSFANLDCTNDYLYLFNGPYATAPRIDRICNGEGKANYSSEISSESILIEYHSENYKSNSTFSIDIEATYDRCGGSLRSGYTIFTNPLNGSQYPNNVECIWTLQSKAGTHIGLEFVNRFYLEQSDNCTKDYVEAFDRNGTEWISLGRVCGRSVPRYFNSTTNEMRVVFRTDGAVTADGFTAIWVENCGGTFVATTEVQYLTSPNYPLNYPRSTVCNYTIVAPVDTFINVKFTDFDFEYTQRGCSFDNLTVSRHREYYPTDEMEVMGTYCGLNALNVLRYKHKIGLVLATDLWLERSGFRLEYRLDKCGGNITHSQSISVPTNELTNSYYESLNCVWNITAPAGQHIVIRFGLFDVEHNDYCYIDYVEVYVGHEQTYDKRLIHLCGNLTHHTPVIKVNQSEAIIKFQSDSATQVAAGMSAVILFVKDCDRKIDLTSGTPTYTLNEVSSGYEESLDCHYTVSAPDGFVIEVVFNQFHLAPCNNSECACDFVALYDGAGPFSEPIGSKLCGHELPANVTTTNNKLWVRFATDAYGSSTGFSATFSIRQSVCGQRVIELNDTAQSHVLQWPDDKSTSKYPPNARCNWNIKTDYGKAIHITIDRVDTENSTDDYSCLSSDYLEMQDIVNHQYITEGLGEGMMTTFSGQKRSVMQPSFYQNKMFASTSHYYCGSAGKSPIEFVSANEEVLIKFRSNDNNIVGNGFRLTAQLLRACQRNFTELQGRIVSKVLETCETYVTVPANHTITLYFGRFTIYPLDYNRYVCSDDTRVLAIYDGDQMAKSICAQTTPTPFFSTTNRVTLKFNKIQTLDYGLAYDITYVASSAGRGCGGQLFNYGGTFTSPLYPSNEQRSIQDCKWDIKVPDKLVVALQFEVFDMGATSEFACRDNFLDLIEYDAATEENTVIRHFCGNDNPSNYTSSNNAISVRFRRNLNFAGTGWIINFMGVHPKAVPIY